MFTTPSWSPGSESSGGLVGQTAVGQPLLGFGVDLVDGLLEVVRLAERLANLTVNAQEDFAAVALGVEEVDAVGVAVRHFLLDGDALGLERWWYICSVSMESTRHEIWCVDIEPGSAVRPRCSTNSWNRALRKPYGRSQLAEPLAPNVSPDGG